MTTLFSTALKVVGLSHHEAAEYLGVSPFTVNSWSSGKRRPPDQIWDSLRDLYRTQNAFVEATSPVDDDDLPSPGAVMAVLARRALK